MVYAFGDCRLDLERRELWRGAALIDLEPQVFDLLAYLVHHRGRVVSKDDLIATVWNGRIVSDSAVTTRINAVRRALGDDGASQRLVRTFARRGVRFVGEVTENGTEMPPDTLGGPATRPILGLAGRPSIAVLPFGNLTGNPEQEYFADGVVEEITTAIARCPWLFVIARNSSSRYKGKPIYVNQTARELGVRYILEGSVRKAGNRMRIAGQLIELLDRRAYLGRPVRRQPRRHLRVAGPGGKRRCRRNRAAAAARRSRARRPQADREPACLRPLLARPGASIQKNLREHGRVD